MSFGKNFSIFCTLHLWEHCCAKFQLVSIHYQFIKKESTSLEVCCKHMGPAPQQFFFKATEENKLEVIEKLLAPRKAENLLFPSKRFYIQKCKKWVHYTTYIRVLQNIPPCSAVFPRFLLPTPVQITASWRETGGCNSPQYVLDQRRPFKHVLCNH